MKSKLDCEIVRDLLPTYIDRLTSEKTTEAVIAHLSECESCRAVYRDMTNSEPLIAEQPEIDYLKKVRNSRRRIRNIAIIAACGLLAAGVAAFTIAKYAQKKSAQDAQTISALEERSEADAKTITELSEAAEALQEQIDLPTVIYDAETRALVITGTDRYDEVIIPDEAEEALTLDVQDDQFHMSVFIPLLQNGSEPLKTYLPAYIDRTDNSLHFLRSYLKGNAGDAYPTNRADKMVEINIRTDDKYLYRNEQDRILLNLCSAYWHRDALYMYALMDAPHTAWGQIGLAWYTAVCVNPYTEMLTILDPSASAPYDDLYYAAGGTYENATNDDLRIQFDVISRYCFEKGFPSKRWGTVFESVPLNRTTPFSGSPETYEQDSSMSVIMAAAFVGWLDRQYGFEAVSNYCFEKKTFDEAFGTDFDTEFAAWKAWIIETYPMN